jgi:hypothetical protein
MTTAASLTDTLCALSTDLVTVTAIERDERTFVIEGCGADQSITAASAEAAAQEAAEWVELSEEPDHEPRVALHNDPSSPTCVSEMTDAEVAFCYRNAVLMDDEIREQINGRTDDDREWLALYAAAHEAVHGAPWCLP